MIKILDPKGEPMEVTEKLWESLSAMKNCNYRLAEVPIPKEVVEFKPTPAKQPSEVEKLIKEKQCCKEKCTGEVTMEKTGEVIEVPQPEIDEKPKEKRTTKKKGKK
jgi:hypothetical protein